MFFGTGIIKISVRDVLYGIFRHKWKSLAFFLFVVFAATLYTFLIQEVYMSEAGIVLLVGRESLSVDPSVSGPTVSVFSNRESEINSELSIILSRSLVEKVVDKLTPEYILSSPDETATGENAKERFRVLRRVERQVVGMARGVLVALQFITPLEPRDKAIKKVALSLSAEVEKRSSIIHVYYKAPGPQLAQRVLQELLNFYLIHHIEVYKSQATPAFFEEQVNEFKRDLDDREHKLEEFRTTHAISNLDGQSFNELDILNRMELQLTDAKVQVDSAKARIAELENELTKLPKIVETRRVTGKNNIAADDLKERLVDLRMSETTLAARYPDDHRPLVKVRQQISEAENALSKEAETHTEVTTGLDLNNLEIQLSLEKEKARLSAEQARVLVLTDAVAKKRQTVADLAGKEVELNALSREVLLAEQEYQRNRDTLLRAQVYEQLDRDNVSNVKEIQPATLPLDPIRPRKLLNIAAGILLGLFGGLCLALVLEFLDETLCTKEKAERWLGVPVLAVISDDEYKACALESNVRKKG